MRKQDLTAEVAEKAGIKPAEAGKAIDALFETIGEEIKAGGRIQILGFGTFCTKIRSERICRNPINGEKFLAPAKRIPCFRASQRLKKEVAE